METLRYFYYLKKDGFLISNTDPYESDNYPEIEKIMSELNKIPNRVLLNASKLALSAGNKKAANMVVLGAASPFLNLGEDAILDGMKEFFASKGERIINVNMDAFNAGKEVALEMMQKK